MDLSEKLKHPKINFLIIGTQKGGTSALDYYLRQHPEIAMGNEKEIHFFDDEEIFKNSLIDYSEYENKFDLSGQKKIAGEATPVYMYWEPCIRRIWEYNKNIKLIIILRNPVDRAFSHWNMHVSRNVEMADFMYCIKNEYYRAKEALPLQDKVYCYIDRGFYSEQIRRILRFFNKRQLFFIKYEKFITNQKYTLKQLFDFLGVTTRNFHFEEKKVNISSYQRTITKEEKEYLVDLFINDINEVERILQWNCADWKIKTL